MVLFVGEDLLIFAFAFICPSRRLHSDWQGQRRLAATGHSELSGGAHSTLKTVPRLGSIAEWHNRSDTTTS